MHRKAYTARKYKDRREDGQKVKKAQKLVRYRNQKSLLYQAPSSIVEKKSFDAGGIVVVAMPLTSSFTTPRLLSGCIPGTSFNNRIGRKIRWVSLQFRHNVFPAGGATGVSQNRILIVYDKQNNGGTPAVTDIVQVSAFVSPLNLDNADRFIVICDEITPSVQSNALNVSCQRYIKLNLESIYNTGTAGTAADCLHGAIFVMFANNADSTAGNGSGADFYARLRFVDC